MEHICIDVAIPNYKSPFLTETIASVLNQEPGPFSLNIYVVDDGSDINYLTKVQKDYKPHGVEFHINKKNLGPPGNYNRCLELAKNKYVHILHSDDMVDPQFYNRMAVELIAKPQLALLSCASRSFDGTSYTKSPIIDYNLRGIFEHLKFGNCLVASAVLLKTEVARQLLFRNYAQHVCDWDMWTRVASTQPAFYITEILHTYRNHDTNDTNMQSHLDVLNANLLLQQNLLRDGTFVQNEASIGKQGLVNNAKYRAEEAIRRGKIKLSIEVGVFILKNVGFTYFISLLLGTTKVLLSHIKHTILKTKHA